MEDLTLLHDEAELAADESLALDVFYIVVWGTSIVGGDAWLVAKGCPASVPSESIIEHESACGDKKAFRITENFRDLHPSLARAIREVADTEGCHWTWQTLLKGQPVAEDEIKLERLSDCVHWLVGARRVTRVRGVTGFTAKGIKLR